MRGGECNVTDLPGLAGVVVVTEVINIVGTQLLPLRYTETNLRMSHNSQLEVRRLKGLGSNLKSRC